MSTQQRLHRLEQLMQRVAFDVPILKHPAKLPTLELNHAAHVRNLVCSEFEVTLSELLSRRRTQAISRARFAATYLIREQTKPSTWHELAFWTGRRDHGSAMHALARAKEMMEPNIDPHFAAKVTAIRQKISVTNG